MPRPPPRRFQIHLSTAIVLMLVAGVLMWLNTYASPGIYYSQGRRDAFVPLRAFGWPITAFERGYYMMDFFSNDEMSLREHWEPACVILDAGFALIVLLSVLSICEWRVRRRTRV